MFFSSFYVFTIIVIWYKVNFSQNLGGASAPLAPPVSTGLIYIIKLRLLLA